MNNVVHNNIMPSKILRKILMQPKSQNLKISYQLQVKYYKLIFFKHQLYGIKEYLLIM